MKASKEKLTTSFSINDFSASISSMVAALTTPPLKFYPKTHPNTMSKDANKPTTKVQTQSQSYCTNVIHINDITQNPMISPMHMLYAMQMSNFSISAKKCLPSFAKFYIIFSMC